MANLPFVALLISGYVQIRAISGSTVELSIKIDTGYHRAGLKPKSPDLMSIINRIMLTMEPSGCAKLTGFYSHAGHSYNVSTKSASLCMLQEEITGLNEAADISNGALRRSKQSKRRWVMSVGATPSVTSIQDLEEDLKLDDELGHRASQLKKLITELSTEYEIELHAGVYPLLDLQQAATRTEKPGQGTEQSTDNMALTILAEVVSSYPERSEALLAAGTLSLGREPCKSYPGWGKVTPWNTNFAEKAKTTSWMIGRISQEHSVLVKEVPTKGEREGEDSDEEDDKSARLHVGQQVRIWPNHACIAGAGFGWYLVVDSSLPKGQQDTIVDVWVRCRGW